MKFYHETDEKNVPTIKARGLTSSSYRAGWFTVTDNWEGAVDYTGGGPERVILEFDIPDDLVKEYIWVKNASHWGEGKQYALRKPLEPKFLKKVHDKFYDVTRWNHTAAKVAARWLLTRSGTLPLTS